VRLLLKPGGQSKGCAYVQFGNDGDVIKALENDRLLWHDKHLEAARSDPPRKGSKGGRGAQAARGEAPVKGRGRGGGGHERVGLRGRSDGAEGGAPAVHPHVRLAATAMMPRAVASKGKGNSRDVEGGQGGGVPASIMGNADFKIMLGL
jgi:hypothetical protein